MLRQQASMLSSHISAKLARWLRILSISNELETVSVSGGSPTHVVIQNFKKRVGAVTAGYKDLTVAISIISGRKLGLPTGFISPSQPVQQRLSSGPTRWASCRSKIGSHTALTV